MKVMSVVGARPQFVKLAAIAAACTEDGVDHTIVHTGQHYDSAMSDVFFQELAIPEPHVNLGVGSSSHGRQTGAMMIGLEDTVLAGQPDWVLTYGDTNSTIAAALVAAKLQVPTAHLEAGLRSFNRAMPEEHNRVLTDHASDLLLAPSQTAMQNLAVEGLSERAELVGDVMLDIALRVRSSLDERDMVVELPEEPFVLATVHRQENTDSPARLRAIVESLKALDMTVLLPAHPRLLDRCHRFDISLDDDNLLVRSPLSYREIVATLTRAKHVVTDSGGLQKEAYFFGVPCSTLRAETEWTETLEGSWNRLVADLPALHESVRRPAPAGVPSEAYGTGRASTQVLRILRQRHPKAAG